MKNSTRIRSTCKVVLMMGFVATLSACSSLLPQATQATKTPWNSYAEAEAMYAKIIPQKTTVKDLKAIFVDPEKTPNVAVLSHAEVLRKVVPVSGIEMRLLAPSVQDCIAAHQTCSGYQIEQTYVHRHRNGNFFLDFMNFKRKTDVSGWQFDAIIVINNDVVVYKLWSGKPSTQHLDEESNPLGPLQGFGPSLITPLL